MTLRVLAATAMYPSEADPARGSFVASQVQSLRDAGVHVDVVVFPPRGGMRGYARAAREIARAARAARADVVHAHYGLVGWSACWQPVPVVTAFCGDDLQGTVAPRGGITMKSRIGIAMSQQAARRSAGIVCKSEALRARIRDPRARARAVVIPNGVDTTRFAPGDRAAARGALGLPARGRIVLFPNSAHEPNKRLPLAQAAAALLTLRVPDARLVIAAGVRHELMPLWFRAADVTLLTSNREGSPNVVKESLLSGTPVVTTDVGDVRRWVTPARGRIVAGDAAAIASALEEVLARPPVVDVAPLRTELSADAVARRLVSYFEATLDRVGGTR